MEGRYRKTTGKDVNLAFLTMNTCSLLRNSRATNKAKTGYFGGDIHTGFLSTISRSEGSGQGKPNASNTSFSVSPAITLLSLIRPSLYLILTPLEMA